MGNTSRSSITAGGYDSIDDVVDIEINSNNMDSSSFLDDVADNSNDDDDNKASTITVFASDSSVVKLWNIIISRRLIIAIVVAFVLTTFFVRTTSSSGGRIFSTYSYEATATTSSDTVTMNSDAGADAVTMNADAAIIVSSEKNPGGCRTSKYPVPHDSKNPNYQPFGEPMLQLDFLSDSYAHGGGYQDSYAHGEGYDQYSTFELAWQGCAKQCNWDHKCHTYTANISQRGGVHPGVAAGRFYQLTCYLHGPYSSLSKGHSQKGRYVSGVCRLNS